MVRNPVCDALNYVCLIQFYNQLLHMESIKFQSIKELCYDSAVNQTWMILVFLLQSTNMKDLMHYDSRSRTMCRLTDYGIPAMAVPMTSQVSCTDGSC